MEHHVKLTRFLFVLLLMIVYTTQAAYLHNTFEKLKSGENIKGTIETQLTTRSKLHCSDRCSHDVKCKAYIYQRTRIGNCMLIDTKWEDFGKTFHITPDFTIYRKVKVPTPPSPPSVPVRHWSFDNLDGLVLMEGTVQAAFNTLTTGKVNNALITDRTRSQWIDLGIHAEACMTRPETCGAAGGVVSFWVKMVADCPDVSGIISSYIYDYLSYRGSTGFSMACFDGSVSWVLYLPVGYLDVDLKNLPDEWTHVVLNYVGHEKCPGIKSYENGMLTAADGIKNRGWYTPADGRVVVGRTRTTVDHRYGSVMLDELMLFNTTLSKEQIRDLSAHV